MTFDKIQHSFIMKILEREGTCVNVIKATYSKPIANININGVKFKAFP